MEWKQSIKEEIYKDIKSRADERRDFARVLRALEYNPTKDGKERARFDANFALHGLGERWTLPSGYSGPWVEVTPNYRGGSADAIDIRISDLDEAEAETAGVGGKFPGDTWRFYLPRYSSTVKSVPAGTPAKSIVELVHSELIPGLEREIARIESDLGKLDDFMDEAVRLGRLYKAFADRYKDTGLEFKVCKVRDHLERIAD